MSTFVFVGPTLSPQRVREVLPSAVVLPPVGRGDVLRLVLDNESGTIAIVDGFFGSALAVWHKEILYALHSGWHVFGASSMGALRAAELSAFGMTGVGKIYSRFSQGLWDADDEVAVAHGPAESGYRMGSVALANIRLALEEARHQGIISRLAEEVIVSRASRTFYADRSWQRAFAEAKTDGVPPEQVDRLREFVRSAQPDAKRDDALELLRELRAREESSQEGQPHVPSFDFEPSIYWQRLVADVKGAGDQSRTQTGGITRRELDRHVRLQPGWREVQRGAALLYLLQVWDGTSPRSNSPEDLREATLRFRRKHGLLTGEQTLVWCRQQELSDEEFHMLVRLENALDMVLAENGSAVDDLALYELKRQGKFATARQAVEAKRRLLRDADAPTYTLEDAGVSFSVVMDWYQQNCESVEGSLDTHASSLGFSSVREFLCEVLLEYKLKGAAQMAFGHPEHDSNTRPTA
jgi:hypothetical protein